MHAGDNRCLFETQHAYIWLPAGTYEYMDDLLQLEACHSVAPTHLPSSMEEVRSPLSWCEWDRSLATHPNQLFRHYITEDLQYGFRVGFDYHHRCQPSWCNMVSALEQPQVIRDYLATECSEGQVLGPLDPSTLPQVNTSWFGVIPKGKQ